MSVYTFVLYTGHHSILNCRKMSFVVCAKKLVASVSVDAIPKPKASGWYLVTSLAVITFAPV